MRFILLILLFSIKTKLFTTSQAIVENQCETAPYWTIDGRNIMHENRGNVTLIAFMELHCSFCRSQVEGFMALSKMLKNQSVAEVQIILVAPWNESVQYVHYYRSYLEPYGVKVFQDSPSASVWAKLKGNKDDFYIYDAMARDAGASLMNRNWIAKKLGRSETIGIKALKNVLLNLVKADLSDRRKKVETSSPSQATNDESAIDWSPKKFFNGQLLKSDNKLSFECCGRLNYYIPYPQSYLYYHYTISTLYSTLRQEKCGPCRFSMKVRAYLNIVRGNTTTHEFETDTLRTVHTQTSTTPGPDAVPRVTQVPGQPLDVTSPIGLDITESEDRNQDELKPKENEKITVNKKRPPKPRKKNLKTTTTPALPTISDNEDIFVDVITGRPSAMPTPVLISISSAEEDIERHIKGGEITGSEEVPTTTSVPKLQLSETTAQIPETTSVTETVPTSTSTYDDSYEESEYDDNGVTDSHLNGGGAVGSVGAPVIGRRLMKKRYNRTTTLDPTSVSKPATRTTTPVLMTTSWSYDPKAPPKTDTPFKTGWGTTRVPKLPDDMDCTPYTTSMCYRQWQEFGTLHICCQRGVYLTDMCKQPLCNNATYNLCCFQKYQQARFQCCYDNDLPADQPDDFSRCCYRHFVFDDDGNGDGDDQCCPRSTASYFWTTQTRVAELCLPNVQLDLEGLVLEARMTDKSLVNIPLETSTALQYECPYVDKRHDFFYWEPDPADGAIDMKSTVTPNSQE